MRFGVMKALLRFWILTLGYTTLPAGAVAAQAVPDSVVPTLNPGDALRIVVWNREELSGDFDIMADGRIAHPLLQDLVVLNRSFEEVRDDVFRYLARFQNQPQAVVTPLRRIAVGGAVTSPGVVALDPRKRLLDAIGLAGGPTDQARFDKVRLVRSGEETNVPLWGADAARQTLLSLDIRSGDRPRCRINCAGEEICAACPSTGHAGCGRNDKAAGAGYAASAS